MMVSEPVDNGCARRLPQIKLERTSSCVQSINSSWQDEKAKYSFLAGLFGVKWSEQQRKAVLRHAQARNDFFATMQKRIEEPGDSSCKRRRAVSSVSLLPHLPPPQTSPSDVSRSCEVFASVFISRQHVQSRQSFCRSWYP